MIVKMKNIPLNERIIFALDVATAEEAKHWVKRLESHVGFFKVGLELFIGEWFPVVDWIIDRGHKVMLDLKLYDVPETVKRAVKQIRNKNVSFVTIHGNDPIVKAAAEVKQDLKLLAITVLTSFGENDMNKMGMTCSVEELVQNRAQSALEFGCDGVVASGLEAGPLRSNLGNDFFIVTPGIRPGGNVSDDADDQVRIVTAQKAILSGADHVVVGRPIRNAKDPIAVVESMQKDISVIE